MKAIIEHLEPKVYEWCEIEYAHISEVLGKENVIFTNVSSKKLEKLGKVENKRVRALKLKNACLLDPEAPQTLSPADAKQFEYFIFGGILGDDPPKARTKTELTKFLPYPCYNLGKEQMSTDTAVIVTKQIFDGTPLAKLKFVDSVEIQIEDGVAVTLPYRYLILNKKLVIAEGIIDLLREQKSF